MLGQVQIIVAGKGDQPFAAAHHFDQAKAFRFGHGALQVLLLQGGQLACGELIQGF